MIHIDWMIGSKDINIDGIKENKLYQCLEMVNG